jgi:hypothetical protein
VRKVPGFMEMEAIEMALEFGWNSSKPGMNIAATNRTGIPASQAIGL